MEFYSGQVGWRSHLLMGPPLTVHPRPDVLGNSGAARLVITRGIDVANFDDRGSSHRRSGVRHSVPYPAR
jgi:hypothetical protein